MHIAVGIATTGRPALLSEMLFYLAKQTRPPDSVRVCVAKPDDIEMQAIAPLGESIQVFSSSPGSSNQRNAILDRSRDSDIILFLDDDFFIRSDYVANVEALFARHADIALVTGALIADGVRGKGYTADEARELIRQTPPNEAGIVKSVYSGYGCNMAVRMSLVVANQLRFDENLPLYGWLEDLDFTRRIAPYGRVVQADHLRGVHLATKTGRVSGVRYGYSQVANPLYLYKKKSIPFHLALRRAGRFCLANIVRSAFPEEFIDRRGRVRGNWMAVADLLKGELDPRRVVRL